MTCRRDRLPKGVPSKHWCKEKTDNGPRAKAARFMCPIFAIKKIGTNSTIQVTSFQLTSSCDIISVNALNQCSLFSQMKQRGRGKFKRQWGIEMNEAHQLCLQTCGRIDTIDHLVKNCKLGYRCVALPWHSLPLTCAQ